MTDPQISLLWIEIATTAEAPELAAAAAAYALVACVDHELAADELSRFRELVPAQGRGEGVRTCFDENVTVLRADFAKGREHCFGKLEAIAGSGVPADRVLRIAQMAVVADLKIDEAEESILQEIAAALGMAASA